MSGALARSVWSVSLGSDGECVGVIGEDSPFGPDLLALGALQAAAAHPVAALEVADPALLAGSVALQPAIGASGAGFLAAGDEHSFWCEFFERLFRRARHESAVERELARGDLKPFELGDRAREQSVLSRVARCG